MQTMTKHILWPIIDSSSLYTTIYTRSRCCYTPNRWAWSLSVTWQRWRSHHSIRSYRKPPAIRKLYGSMFYSTGVIAHCIFCIGNREFRVFLRKIMENIIFPICVAKLMQMMPKHIFWLVCCRSYTHCFTPNRLVWSLPVMWQRWRSHHLIRQTRKPPPLRVEIPMFACGVRFPT